MSFELELPRHSKIHPVFHVSQLKPCYANESSELPLPLEAADNCPLIQPMAVLDWKINAGSPHVLIQWTGLYPEDATWEPYPTISHDFPDFHLEDRCLRMGNGML